MNIHQPSFEYRKVGEDATIFETFLKCTDEKEQSSNALADIFDQQTKQIVKVLDIGAGNGDLLRLTLTKTTSKSHFHLTLIEPSADLVKVLRHTITAPDTNIHTIGFREFSTNEKYDIIIASHIFYHFPRTAWRATLQKMISLLSTSGVLIIVARDKDDVYTFKNTFRPVLINEPYKATTIDDIVDVLRTIEAWPALRTERRTVSSKLSLANHDAQSLKQVVQFYVHVPWDEIPPEQQRKILTFISSKNYRLDQLDGFLFVRRNNEIHTT